MLLFYKRHPIALVLSFFLTFLLSHFPFFLSFCPSPLLSSSPVLTLLPLPLSLHLSDKVNMTKKDNLLIYQSTLVPPQFKVVIGETVFDVAKGHNNLFHALVLFLLHIKSLEHGVLGRINLGLTGLNILNILN